MLNPARRLHGAGARVTAPRASPCNFPGAALVLLGEDRNRPRNPGGPMTSSERDDAFEDLIRRHGGRLLATARRILRNDEEAAHDAVQDAFLSAYQSLPDFRGEASLPTWLHRIVVNAALMRRRSRQRRRETPI